MAPSVPLYDIAMSIQFLNSLIPWSQEAPPYYTILHKLSRLSSIVSYDRERSEQVASFYTAAGKTPVTGTLTDSYTIPRFCIANGIYGSENGKTHFIKKKIFQKSKL